MSPDPLHACCTRYFGNGDARTLHAGDNNSGEITLVSTGSISGSVVDPSGRSLNGVFVWVGFGANDVRYGGYTDPRGRFLIPHVVPGSYAIEANGDSYASHRLEDLRVEPGVTMQGVNFELEPALSISGVVVDDAGAPLAGVQVGAAPDVGLSNRYVRSAEDGSFTILLEWNVPTRILAFHDDFAQVMDPAHHAPGARDVRVSMARRPLWTFRVIDAKTRLSIGRYHAQVRLPGLFDDGGDYLMPAPQHPDGTIKLAVRPGMDKVVFVAEDRLSREVGIDPSTPAGTTIVVEL